MVQENKNKKYVFYNFFLNIIARARRLVKAAQARLE